MAQSKSALGRPFDVNGSKWRDQASRPKSWLAGLLALEAAKWTEGEKGHIQSLFDPLNSRFLSRRRNRLASKGSRLRIWSRQSDKQNSLAFPGKLHKPSQQICSCSGAVATRGSGSDEQEHEHQEGEGEAEEEEKQEDALA